MIGDPPTAAVASRRAPLESSDVDQRSSPASMVALVVLGAVMGAGQLWGGLYDVRSWGPVAIVAIAAAIALVVGRWALPSRSGVLLAGVLVGFAAVSALSSLWAESGPAAATEAHRWSLYAAVAVLSLLLVRGPAEQRALVLGFGAAGAAVGGLLWAEMLLGTGTERFTVMRLSEPLGYANGQAAAFVLAAWPAIALAERADRTWLKGVGAAVAVLMLGLTVLTQSRGATIGLLGSLLAVLVVLPGRERRLWLLVVVLGGVAVAAPTLLDVYTSLPAQPGRPDDDVLSGAAAVLGVAALVTGGLWALLTTVLARSEQGVRLRAAQAGRVVVAAVATVVLVAGLAAVGNPIDRGDRLLDQFTSLQAPTFAQEGSRLTSGGGNRYDYWRVAVKEFQAEPVAGIGAGNYTRDYFRLRATTEDVRQPHSLQMQSLAELGLVGLALVAVLFGALGLAMWRAGRMLAADRVDGVAAVGGVGIIAMWAVQTSVDWLHLLPSLTCAVVAVAAALLAVPAPRAGRPNPVLVVAPVLLLVLAAAGIGRLALAADARRDAEVQLTAAPAEAVALADRALRLQPDDVRSLYVKAAAYAQLNRYGDARDALVDATRAEPSNFVPRVLLGDLALRRGDRALARQRYLEAQRRNPLDPQIPARLQLTAPR